MVLPPIKLLLITLALTLSGSFHFGYQLIIPNPAAVAFQNFINESFFDHHGFHLSENHFRYIWPLFLNVMNIGGFIGALLLNPLAEKLGRKRSFYVVAVLQAFGSLVSGLSYYFDSWELLTLGRLISGISIGISMGLQPMYFSEISPKAFTGLLNGMTGSSLELGFVLGSVVALPVAFGSEILWHWLFWLEFLTTFITLIVLPLIPESPKFILASSHDYVKAKESLTFFLHPDVEGDIQEIEKEIGSQKEIIALMTIFKTPYLRRGLVIGSLTIFACQWSGIGAISFYSTYLFEQAGIPADVAPYATVAVTFNTLLAALISSFIVDRFGRRPLILVGLTSLAVLNVIFVIFTFVGKQIGANWPGYICVVDTIVFTFMFGIGPAVVMWFVTAELMPQNARSKAISFVQSMQWIVLGLANGIFYPLEGVIHEWSFFMFIIPLSAATIYLYFKFPETKGKTTLEIIESLGYIEDDSKIDAKLIESISLISKK